jgi:sortase A
MKPNEPNSSQSGLPLSQQGLSSKVPENQSNQASRDAATDIIRSHIDSLYSDVDKPVKPVPTPTATATPVSAPTATPIAQSTPSEKVNPYNKTHSSVPTLQKTNDWGQYHSAWQNYYQKYYEGYYTHQLEKTRQIPKTNSPAENQKKLQNENNYFSNQEPVQSEQNIITSKEEIMLDLRQEITGKISKSATKIKKSRHFIPIISGIIVVILFIFLQYNRIFISSVMAYVSPGNIDPQNIVVNPNAESIVGPEPQLIIPKINVDVPVFYDVGNDYNSQMEAMSKGVAQFAIPGANSHPGQIGNTVIAGHSSNDLLDSGDYKFIFAQLDKLNIGETIYANYNSKRYTYTVTKKETVKPDEVSKLVYPTTKPILTLLTCTPVGTSLNRLLVTADQVSPDPNASIAAPDSTEQTTKTIPGNSPTFIERLFGAR